MQNRTGRTSKNENVTDCCSVIRLENSAEGGQGRMLIRSTYNSEIQTSTGSYWCAKRWLHAFVIFNSYQILSNAAYGYMYSRFLLWIHKTKLRTFSKCPQAGDRIPT